MPYCGCFHDFELTSSGGDSYDLRVALEGEIDLKWLFDETRLASTIVHLTPSFSQYSRGIRLNGVADVRALSVFCSYLKSTLILETSRPISTIATLSARIPSSLAGRLRIAGLGTSSIKPNTRSRPGCDQRSLGPISGVHRQQSDSLRIHCTCCPAQIGSEPI